MRRFIFLAFCITVLVGTAMAQPRTDSFLCRVLRAGNDPLVNRVMADPLQYRVQIIYTQIDRDRHNRPSFRNYYFNDDPQLYFNPASMVKLPLAFLSLEKLNQLHKKGINKYTSMQFDSTFPGQKALYRDSTSVSGLPSIAQFIRRAFLISENDPYNRMYQFVGQQDINRNLHKKGYQDVRITRQFMGFTPEQNRHTNAIRFIDEEGKTLYCQPPAYNLDSFDFSHSIQLGKAHYDRNDSLVQEPFDFTMHNNLPLEDMRMMLQSVLFPKSVGKKQRFRLKEDDYRFLYQYLSQYPSETPSPKYDTSLFYDSYVKFFFRDSTRRMPPGVRVFNKVGWSYGFLTDVSYVVDFQHKIEYMLAATLYVNSDNVLNDGKYDYDAVGYPFLNRIGQTIYQYELNRPRPRVPDLSRFQVEYEKRDPNDKRPVLREVDN